MQHTTISAISSIYCTSNSFFEQIYKAAYSCMYGHLNRAMTTNFHVGQPLNSAIKICTLWPVDGFSTGLTSLGPAYQEWFRSCHENVLAPKAVSSDPWSTGGLTLLARIEIDAILVHYQPSCNTSHTQWNPVTHCYLPMSLWAAGCIMPLLLVHSRIVAYLVWIPLH